jgi:hypothetical protein
MLSVCRATSCRRMANADMLNFFVRCMEFTWRSKSKNTNQQARSYIGLRPLWTLDQTWNQTGIVYVYLHLLGTLFDVPGDLLDHLLMLLLRLLCELKATLRVHLMFWTTLHRIIWRTQGKRLTWGQPRTHRRSPWCACRCVSGGIKVTWLPWSGSR